MTEQETETPDQLEASPEEEAQLPAPVLSKKMMLYSIAFLWSFFIIFLVTYFFVYRARMKSATVIDQLGSLASEMSETHQAMMPNSSAADYMAARSNEPMAFDSMNAKQKTSLDPNVLEELASLQAEVKVLLNESRKQQIENDALWTEILAKEQGQKASRDTILVLMSDAKETAEDASSTAPLGSSSEDTSAARIAALKAMEGAERKAAIANSAKIYSAMKPNTAASILAQFDDGTVADILLKIKIRQTAKILEAMSVERATRICRIMAEGGRKTE